MAQSYQFGTPRPIDGKAAQGEPSTRVPVRLLQHLRTLPIPITISGTGNVIFTVNGSVTNPIYLWNGNDFMPLSESVTYTWAAGTNNVLTTSGAAGTLSTAAASTVYYMYLGINSSGSYVLRPSVSAPSFVQGPYEAGRLSHPGTARAQMWNYVGFMAATATNPTFEAMTKIGHTYIFAATSKATATTWTELDFSHVVPKHGALGVTVSGHLETGSEGTVVVGSTSSNTLGVQKAGGLGTTTAVIAAGLFPFSGVNPTANGKVWAQDTVARGDVHISAIHDIV